MPVALQMRPEYRTAAQGIVRAAVIEPDLDHDTSLAPSDQNTTKNIARQGVTPELLDTFRTQIQQTDNTFLRAVCEIYVKWTDLPPAIRQFLDTWNELPDDTRRQLEMILTSVDNSAVSVRR